MYLKGVGGQVAFDGLVVTIERKGVMGRFSGDEKRVYHVRELAAVQTKRANALVNGFIKFIPAIEGDQAHESGEAPRFATPDSNSVNFYKKDQPAFEELRDAVLDAMSRPDTPPTNIPD